MKTIISNDGSLVLTDEKGNITSIPIGTQVCASADPHVVVQGDDDRIKWVLLPSATMVDDVTYATPYELIDKISSYAQEGGGPSPGGGVESIEVGPGLSVDDSDPTKPVISLERQGVSDNITATGDGEVEQEIVYDTGISDLNSAVVTPVNMAARDAGIQSYEVTNGLITLTIGQAIPGAELVYSYAALAGTGGINNSDLTIVAGKNKFDKTTAIPNTGINNLGVIITIADWSGAYIPVEPETRYAFKHNDNAYAQNQVGQLAFCRQDRSIISTVNMATFEASCTGGGKTFVTPADCYYIFKNLVVLTRNYLDDFQLEEGCAVTTYEPYVRLISEINQMQLKAYESPNKVEIVDKNVAFFGDSIAASTVYDIILRISTHIGFKNIQRLARSGAKWTHTVDTVYDITSTGGSTSPDNVIWNQINRLQDLIERGLAPIPDIAIMSAGTNDLSSARGDVATAFTGSILDRAANTILTLTEAVRFDCEFILSLYPNCQIILVSPLQRAVANSQRIHEVGDLMEACGQRLSANCIRQDYETGIYSYKEYTPDHLFLYDGLHPNQLGANKIGDYLATRFLGIISK